MDETDSEAEVDWNLVDSGCPQSNVDRGFASCDDDEDFDVNGSDGNCQGQCREESGGSFTSHQQDFDELLSTSDDGADRPEGAVLAVNPATLEGRSILDTTPNSADASSETSLIAKQIEACLLNGEESLEISNSALSQVPPTLLQLENLQNLYMDGNELLNLPDTFFPRLKSLKWLDLRYNYLEYLPKNIGEHSNLSTILLEGNRLQMLPPELGLLPNLRGLNIRDNPLVDPPQNVLKLGFKEILYYLRQHVPVYNEENDIFCLKSGSKSATNRSSRNQTSRKSKSSVSSGNNSVKKRSSGLIPYELSAEYLGPSTEMLEARANSENENNLLRLRQEQIDAFVQHMKSEIALKTWRQKARREQIEAASTRGSRNTKDVALTAPFATYENFLVMMSKIQLQNMEFGNTSKKFPQPMPGFIDAARRKKERELERQIWIQLEKLQESSQDGSVELHDAAAQLSEVERLQRELSSLFRPLL